MSLYPDSYLLRRIELYLNVRALINAQEDGFRPVYCNLETLSEDLSYCRQTGDCRQTGGRYGSGGLCIFARTCPERSVL